MTDYTLRPATRTLYLLYTRERSGETAISAHLSEAQREEAIIDFANTLRSASSNRNDDGTPFDDYEDACDWLDSDSGVDYYCDSCDVEL